MREKQRARSAHGIPQKDHATVLFAFFALFAAFFYGAALAALFLGIR